MIKVAYSSSFKRSYKRKIAAGSEREAKMRSKLELFMKDPFDDALRTHKLSGKLKNYWSFSIEYDLRVIFYFEDAETAVFVDLGTHREVY